MFAGIRAGPPHTVDFRRRDRSSVPTGMRAAERRRRSNSSQLPSAAKRPDRLPGRPLRDERDRAGHQTAAGIQQQFLRACAFSSSSRIRVFGEPVVFVRAVQDRPAILPRFVRPNDHVHAPAIVHFREHP